MQCEDFQAFLLEFRLELELKKKIQSEGRAQSHHEALCTDLEMLSSLFCGHLSCIPTPVDFYMA